MPEPKHHFEPMTIGMLLDKAFRLYVQNFSLMLVLSAIAHTPFLVFRGILAARRITGVRSTLREALYDLLGTIIIILLVSPLISGATAKAVSDIYLGKSVTASEVFSAAWRKVWTLLKAHFAASILVILGLFLLVVPGILWALAYFLISPIVMIEGMSNSADIRQRSWKLVRGNRGKVFFIWLTVFRIGRLARMGVRYFAQFFIGAANVATIDFIIVDVVLMLTSPLSAISTTLLYYDFRIRQEGFDLEMLSQAMCSTAKTCSAGTD